MQEQFAHPVLHWTENDTLHSARWRSESGLAPPKRVVIADDRISADSAYRFACEGTALLWRGDFNNARQLLQAVMRRIDKPRKGKSPKTPVNMTEAFHLHRQAQSQRARTLAMILIPLEADYAIPLRRAPDIKQACNESYGKGDAASIVPLREVLGFIGAHEWRKKGVEIPALGARIHPHYGVFSPIRGEYIDLVAQAPLPDTRLAFDIGTGTGVLSAVLAKRGVTHIIATDMDGRALSCARDNIEQLGYDKQVEIVQADLFPPGKAPLIVCNPPWVPARPSSSIEAAVYDPESKMLKGFLNGLAEHLDEGGEGWLILSDIAEHLGLRTRDELLGWIEKTGLKVKEKMDIRPRHGKAMDKGDPLYEARVAEITSLWKLIAQ